MSRYPIVPVTASDATLPDAPRTAPALVDRAWQALVFVVIAAMLTLALREARVVARPELLRHAAWRVSSTTIPGAGAGRGLDRTSEGLPNHFFQTTIEPSPWIEFDLGGLRGVTFVHVQNRLDCCRDWPVPLVVELSDDRARWLQVARRDEAFDTWSAVFPEARGRYLRLRVPRETQLKLGWVEAR